MRLRIRSKLALMPAWTLDRAEAKCVFQEQFITPPAPESPALQAQGQTTQTRTEAPAFAFWLLLSVASFQIIELSPWCADECHV
ncbi:hypothetical protein IWQ52_000244 [Labrenzia sp. EL_159]|nr:hypothetical protein [Labrenzia sp. EL_162]MBG6192742.1 hypothetical protein [Labrenzia sp. EL_159]